MGLFNGKIAGLVPMGLSEVIWCQGESNARRVEAYDELFAAMIKSWRKLFEKPEQPFAWCQLAGYMEKATDPNVASEWAELRASQTKTLALPMTGQAVLIDAGEAGVTFADVGRGLVVKDLSDEYVVRSRDNVRRSMKRNSPQTEVEGFAVLGSDGKWAWADKAVIDGSTARVSSKVVPMPIAVRYAWADHPWVNLYNREGFPAEPFDSRRFQNR